jgi:prolyl-tRNA synthetase
LAYSIAPFQFEIIPLNVSDEKVREASGKIYNDLQEAGFEVLIDDREESAGVKFKDADLLGIPYRIVIGAKGLAEAKVEFKERKTGKMWKLEIGSALDEVKRIHREA